MIESRLILRLCDRFHCVPDEAYAMDARVWRLMEIERLSRPETPEGGEEGGW